MPHGRMIKRMKQKRKKALTSDDEFTRLAQAQVWPLGYSFQAFQDWRLGISPALKKKGSLGFSAEKT